MGPEPFWVGLVGPLFKILFFSRGKVLKILGGWVSQITPRAPEPVGKKNPGVGWWDIAFVSGGSTEVGVGVPDNAPGCGRCHRHNQVKSMGHTLREPLQRSQRVNTTLTAQRQR